MQYSLKMHTEPLNHDLAAFTTEATRYVMSLTNPLHKRFGLRYLEYLQATTKSQDVPKPNTVGISPAHTLIRMELERILSISVPLVKPASSGETHNDRVF